MSAFSDDLTESTKYYFDGDYDVVQGRTIPSVTEISFGRSGKEVDLAMLFIDVKESTQIVNGFRLKTAARMYQAFLNGVIKISLKNGGEVRSFNGDGVLVTFYGDSKCNNAVRSALQMMHFFQTVLKPKMANYFVRNKKIGSLVFDCGIGIDVGEVFVVRGGIRGDDNNDLVWVGNPTNYAVKLSAQSKVKISNGLSNSQTVVYNIHITDRVFKKLKPELTTIKGGIFKINIWKKQPIVLGAFLPKSLSSTLIYRTNKTIPF